MNLMEDQLLFLNNRTVELENAIKFMAAQVKQLDKRLEYIETLYSPKKRHGYKEGELK